MNLGNIVRRAASAFGGKSKTRGSPTTGTAGVGKTGARPTGGSHGSPEADLAKSAAKVAKKKL